MNKDAAAAPQARSPATVRLVEVDALRGIAAVLVMLFHFTTRYDELFVHEQQPVLGLPWGHFGVNLFFTISGFVIFLTLEKTKRPVDFLLSRFSRLFPVYWAAIAVTFVVVHALGLPGKAVGFSTAAANMVMIHGLFGVQHVDGVYWTLEVELLFYAVMLGAWVVGALARPRLFSVGWLSCCLIYWGFARFGDIDLPYIASRVLILQYIPYFIIGITIHVASRDGRRPSAADFGVVAGAIGTIGLAGDWVSASAAILCGAAVYLAVVRPPRWLSMRWLVWLGAISYPLYLVHENIGWCVILWLESAGYSALLAVAAAVLVALLIAAGLHYAVEQPAMKAIRGRYRHASAGAGNDWSPLRWAGGIVALLVGLATGSLMARETVVDSRYGQDNLVAIQAPRAPEVECMSEHAPRPLILVVLGQSNAANHGEKSAESSGSKVFVDGRCYLASDPLPGATGSGGSIWTPLAELLQLRYPGKQVILVPLAVDATEIAAWSTHGGIQDGLKSRLRSLVAAGLQPHAILWQQGEADAKLGVSAEDYLTRFDKLRRVIRESGVSAPILVARSSYCRGDGFGVIGRAQLQAASRFVDVGPGPNLDELRGAFRIDGCHFSQLGLREGARRWFQAIDREGLLND